MFQVTKLSISFLILHCVFCSEVKSENMTEISSSDVNIIAERNSDSRYRNCVTTFEQVEHMVHYSVMCHITSRHMTDDTVMTPI